MMEQYPIYFIMALVGTLFYVLKIALMLMGGDADSDFDSDLDSHPDGTSSFTLLSIQSILAFIMAAGWIGLACRREWEFGEYTSILIASVFGFLMMLLNSYFSLKIKSLNDENKFDLEDTVGKEGIVYARIPAKGKGQGQVEIVVQGSKKIIPAKSASKEIDSFKEVKIVEVKNNSVLIVEKI